MFDHEGTRKQIAADLAALLMSVDTAQREAAAGAIKGGIDYHACARIAATLDKVLEPFRCATCGKPHVRTFNHNVCGPRRAGRPVGGAR